MSAPPSLTDTIDFILDEEPISGRMISRRARIVDSDEDGGRTNSRRARIVESDEDGEFEVESTNESTSTIAPTPFKKFKINMPEVVAKRRTEKPLPTLFLSLIIIGLK